MAEARTVEVKVRPHLDAVVVRPGDRLVIRITHAAAPDEVAEWVEHLEEILPGVTPVFVFGEQILVYRDGGPDD